MPGESDERLWRSATAGDARAFEELYRRHARPIYNYLFRRLADWSEAEDLTAVVFLEAYRRRSDAVVRDGKVLPWLYGIATNVLRNRRSLARTRAAIAKSHGRTRSGVSGASARRRQAVRNVWATTSSASAGRSQRRSA
jgi:DNA-directed RNA polymerase specialized sigma24 family protein